jgi:hypothetical protein
MVTPLTCSWAELNGSRVIFGRGSRLLYRYAPASASASTFSLAFQE